MSSLLEPNHEWRWTDDGLDTALLDRLASRVSYAKRVGVVLLALTWALPALAGPLDADEDGAPAGAPALLRAAAGVTAISGRVLSIDGTPLRSVQISDDGARSVTDDFGRYLVESVLPGRSVLVVNGHRATPVGHQGPADYGYYEVAVTAEAGRTKALDYTNWLTPIDHGHGVAVKLPLSRDVAVTTPSVPGLELRLPAGAILTGPDGQLVSQVSLTRFHCAGRRSRCRAM